MTAPDPSTTAPDPSRTAPDPSYRRRRYGALWATGVPAVLFAVAGAAILVQCGERDRCDEGGLGLPSANVFAGMSFFMSALAIGGFATLLSVPPKARVTYPNGKRPMGPPEDE